jgi:hypothetical protein
MQLTRTLHPPAAADPILFMQGGMGWHALFSTVLAGSIVWCSISIYSTTGSPGGISEILDLSREQAAAAKDGDNDCFREKP